MNTVTLLWFEQTHRLIHLNEFHCMAVRYLIDIQQRRMFSVYLFVILIMLADGEPRYRGNMVSSSYGWNNYYRPRWTDYELPPEVSRYATGGDYDDTPCLTAVGSCMFDLTCDNAIECTMYRNRAPCCLYGCCACVKRGTCPLLADPFPWLL